MNKKEKDKWIASKLITIENGETVALGEATCEQLAIALWNHQETIREELMSMEFITDYMLEHGEKELYAVKESPPPKYDAYKAEKKIDREITKFEKKLDEIDAMMSELRRHCPSGLIARDIPKKYAKLARAFRETILPHFAFEESPPHRREQILLAEDVPLSEYQYYCEDC